MTLLYFWLCWHLALALVWLLGKTPAGWWIDAGVMRARMWFFGRVWAGVVPADVWVGGYWDAKKRLLYLALCPCLVLRLDFRKRRGRADAMRDILRGFEEAMRARTLPAAALAEELGMQVGQHLAIFSRADAIVDEVKERLQRGSTEPLPTLQDGYFGNKG